MQPPDSGDFENTNGTGIFFGACLTDNCRLDIFRVTKDLQPKFVGFHPVIKVLWTAKGINHGDQVPAVFGHLCPLAVTGGIAKGSLLII